MNTPGKPFSVILLPTSACNVACDYCFESKTKIRLSQDQIRNLTLKLLDHMERTGVAETEIYWQGGEVMMLSPSWYLEAYETMGTLAAERGLRFAHYMQSNLIGYGPHWDEVIRTMFNSEIGTSMDYPNVHRKLFNGTPEQYTEIWFRNYHAARAAGFEIGVIAVLSPESLQVGADAFWEWFVDEVGVTSFQVNTPFPGGPASEEWPMHSPLDIEKLSAFTVRLYDLWFHKGLPRGIRLGPFDALHDHFTGSGDSRLPCIFKENCANQFISVDAHGTTAQCDCWVTSYPDWSFGNAHTTDNLTEMLRNSPVRERFLKRPKALVRDADCLECKYLSICHGGCPVRAFTATGHIHRKDPYCEMYKAMFAKAESCALSEMAVGAS